MLEYWLEALSDAGIEKIHINTHYLSEQVEAFISNSEFSNLVKLYHEQRLLGTGGSIREMLQSVQEPTVLVAHADNYFEFDWQNLLHAHAQRPDETDMTLLLFETDKPQECGIVELENGVVVAFHEKVAHPPSNLASAATFVLDRDLTLKRLKDYPEVFDFSKECLPTLNGKIYTFKTNGYWCDIGTIDAYRKTNQRLKLQQFNQC